jgi:hypothetical protein
MAYVPRLINIVKTGRCKPLRAPGNPATSQRCADCIYHTSIPRMAVSSTRGRENSTHAGHPSPGTQMEVELANGHAREIKRSYDLARSLKEVLQRILSA